MCDAMRLAQATAHSLSRVAFDVPSWLSYHQVLTPRMRNLLGLLASRLVSSRQPLEQPQGP